MTRSLLLAVFLLLPNLAHAHGPASLPGPFLWGVANAAFQVEGSPLDSDWYRFTHSTGAIKDGSNADIATDFLHRYGEDFALASSIGANAFRISIAWERIQPTRGSWDEKALDMYAHMIEQMRSAGLEPVVTLSHFVLPGWLADEGGLLSNSFPQYYTDFAFHVVQRLIAAPARVETWVTFNEPDIQVFCGYFWSCWPPKEFLNERHATQALANILRAHLALVNKVRATPALSAARFGIAKHWALVQPASARAADQAAAKLYDGIFNRQIMTAVTSGKIHLKMPGGASIDEEIPLQGKLGSDFLGINYYQRSVVSSLLTYPYYVSTTGPGPKNDLGWEIYPEGLYLALKDVTQYGLPILITENGIADRSDSKRGQFLKDHIAAMKRAIHEGAPVEGYLHWSLTDNFEWADGLTPKFGLVEIDYKTLERKPRPSFEVYRQLINSGL